MTGAEPDSGRDERRLKDIREKVEVFKSCTDYPEFQDMAFLLARLTALEEENEGLREKLGDAETAILEARVNINNRIWGVADDILTEYDRNVSTRHERTPTSKATDDE